MLLVEGLALLSAEADQSNLRHEKGMAHSLTGAFSQFVPAVVLGGGPSIDQIIATEIGRPDRWRSLELGVGNSKVNAVYQGPGQMLTAMKDPALLHDRLFGSTGLMDGEAGQSQFQVRSMVIERALEQFNRTKKRVSKANRDVLSLHEELLGELGTRVAGLSELSCYSVDAPESSGDFEATFQAMLPQMAAALSCDMTRVQPSRRRADQQRTGTASGFRMPEAHIHALMRQSSSRVGAFPSEHQGDATRHIR